MFRGENFVASICVPRPVSAGGALPVLLGMFRYKDTKLLLLLPAGRKEIGPDQFQSRRLNVGASSLPQGVHIVPCARSCKMNVDTGPYTFMPCARSCKT